MSTTRSIIVDDIDPSIHYTGSWYPDQGSRDSVGNWGLSYQSTLHGVNSNASLSFAFNGSEVSVRGSNNILNSSGVLDPTWDCFIDGISIGPTAPSSFDGNNWVFCNNYYPLVDGPHVLTVNATVLKNTTFWFDSIIYLPSASVPLNQAAIIVGFRDSRLQYGKEWEAGGGFGEITTVAGSTLTFDFIGVSLSWYGHIPVDLNLSPFSPSSATYSIDGETPISFLLKGLPVDSINSLFHQKLFETNKLSPTSHTLKVVYEGNNSTPLILDYLIIQNGTSSSTTTSLPTSTVSATSTPKKSLAVDSIVGGVIGGLALLVFAVLGFFLLRRRQKRRHQNRDAQEIVLSTPRPFEYTPSNPSAVGFSYSPFPQTAQSRSHVMKGQATSHVSMPSVTNTEPPSTSSGVTAYPTNLHPVPFQQTALHLANPLSSFSSSPLTPSSGQPVPLRPQGRRNPSVPVSAQSNDTRSSNANVVLHADSGIRMPSNTTSTSVVDVPPLYTPD